MAYLDIFNSFLAMEHDRKITLVLLISVTMLFTMVTGNMYWWFVKRWGRSYRISANDAHTIVINDAAAQQHAVSLQERFMQLEQLLREIEACTVKLQEVEQAIQRNERGPS